MTKFAVLTYDFPFKKATNVGDYIQSLAALDSMEKRLDDVIFLNRERLAEQPPDPVKLIMNGWFMHRSDNWPPDDAISPLYVSFHINESVYSKFGTEESINHLLKYQPIGCRDFNTRDFLISRGVQAYFSGCLTLTLRRENYAATQERSGVLFCDIGCGQGSIRSLFARHDISWFDKIARMPRIIYEKATSVNGDRIERALKSALGDAEISHLSTQLSTRLSEAERFAEARRFLNAYATASLVVTSRIHAALPCLAFGTPVLFVEPKVDTSRFAGLINLFNVISTAEVLKSSTVDLREVLRHIEVRREHLEYREALLAAVREFVHGG